MANPLFPPTGFGGINLDQANGGYGQAAVNKINSLPDYGHVQGAQTETPPNVGSDTGGGSGSGGGSAGDAQAALDRLQIDQSLGKYNDSLGRLDKQETTATDNIGNDYTTAYNTLTGQRQTVDRNYTTDRNNQLQDYQGARDNVDQNTRNLLLGARRLLGGQGAGGGSADLYAAPLAASTEGNNKNAVVKQTNERNLGALTTAYDDNKDKIQNSMNDLTKQRDTSINSTKSQFEQQRADILNNIATLTGQKAIINGGNYEQAMAAAQPFLGRITGILNSIDALAARPTGIQTPQVTLSKPDLAQYDLGRFDAPAIAQQDAGLSQPNLAALLGYNQDQKQQLI